MPQCVSTGKTGVGDKKHHPKAGLNAAPRAKFNLNRSQLNQDQHYLGDRPQQSSTPKCTGESSVCLVSAKWPRTTWSAHLSLACRLQRGFWRGEGLRGQTQAESSQLPKVKAARQSAHVLSSSARRRWAQEQAAPLRTEKALRRDCNSSCLLFLSYLAMTQSPTHQQ